MGLSDHCHHYNQHQHHHCGRRRIKPQLSSICSFSFNPLPTPLLPSYTFFTASTVVIRNLPEVVIWDTSTVGRSFAWLSYCCHLLKIRWVAGWLSSSSAATPRYIPWCWRFIAARLQHTTLQLLTSPYSLSLVAVTSDCHRWADVSWHRWRRQSVAVNSGSLVLQKVKLLFFTYG